VLQLVTPPAAPYGSCDGQKDENHRKEEEERVVADENDDKIKHVWPT